jgi:hypothetical protein
MHAHIQAGCPHSVDSCLDQAKSTNISIYFCRSLDATMAWEASWVKVKKALGTWKMQPVFWTALKKGIQHNTRDLQHTKEFLKQAFREQYEIGNSSKEELQHSGKFIRSKTLKQK